MKGRTKREPSLPLKMKYRPDTVKPGDIIILYEKERDDENPNMVKVVQRELQVVEPYPTYVLCVSRKGIRECPTYHDLEQRTKPEGAYSEYYITKKLKKATLQTEE